MIEQKDIMRVVEEFVSSDPDMFVVEVSVRPSGKIVVLIDTLQGVTIEQCVRLSRMLEQSLDRENNDFELEVSSPGLSEPFKVFRQYQKSLGKNVTVLLQDGEKLQGVLRSAEEHKGIVLEVQKKEPIELLFSEIKTTKVLITF